MRAPLVLKDVTATQIDTLKGAGSSREDWQKRSTRSLISDFLPWSEDRAPDRMFARPTFLQSSW